MDYELISNNYLSFMMKFYLTTRSRENIFNEVKWKFSRQVENYYVPMKFTRFERLQVKSLQVFF